MNNNKLKTNKSGRPSVFKEEYIEETRKLATLGVNEEDIAWFFHIHPNTFKNWKKKHPQLLAALKKGKADRNVSLMKAMFENATKRHNASVQIFLAKNWLGMTDRQELLHTGDEKKPVRLVLEDYKNNNNNNANSKS